MVNLLKLMRKFLAMVATKVIALRLGVTHLDYANALCTELPQSDVKKLQRIQNMTAKNCNRSDEMRQ